LHVPVLVEGQLTQRHTRRPAQGGTRTGEATLHGRQLFFTNQTTSMSGGVLPRGR
jgi:hypothetical protein